MGRIYQRKKDGPFYGYWTDVKGQHHRQSLRTQDRAVARARLRELELASTNRAAYTRTSLSEAITMMLEVVQHENADATWHSYAQKGRHLVRLLGDIDIRALDRQRVLGYITRRKQEGARTHTIHKELVVLRRAFTEAGHRDLWKGDVRALIPTVKIDYVPRETWLTEHQALQMFNRVAVSRRPWVALAMYGGMCLGEIERIRWEHIDFANQSVRVPGTKREARWRLIPLMPELAYALESHRRPTGLVVGHWHNVRRALARACELAKVPRVSPNDLRRTCASWLKNKGVDSAVVAAYLGNTTRMIDRVYGRISQETLMEALMRLSVASTCTTGEQNQVSLEDTRDTSDVQRARAKRRKGSRF